MWIENNTAANKKISLTLCRLLRALHQWGSVGVFFFPFINVLKLFLRFTLVSVPLDDASSLGSSDAGDSSCNESSRKGLFFFFLEKSFRKLDFRLRLDEEASDWICSWLEARRKLFNLYDNQNTYLFIAS